MAPGVSIIEAMVIDMDEAQVRTLGQVRQVVAVVKGRFIPKPGTDKQRPLGVAAPEGKIVQRALVAVLDAIYEEDFLGLS